MKALCVSFSPEEVRGRGDSSHRQRNGSGGCSSDSIDDVGGDHDRADLDEENGVGIAGGGGCLKSGSDHGGGGVKVPIMVKKAGTAQES